ncbi:quinone oxidoreductase family protein [Candidatus Poriferisocius sp.]|uniref:quinone oxidoreductase family protein n=1 Tax=Candidatus Poriferisocius sp. TaxID=3101276 RepID=UPI003B02D621
MRAAYHEAQGGLEVLRVGELADPEPGPGEVLIGVRATSMDRVDVYWREGSHGMRLRWPRHVGGRDIAGVVQSVGPGVTTVAPGNRVVASGERAHATLALAPAELVFPLPGGITFEAGGATPTAGRSAHQALIQKARIQPGETVLVMAAGSGVGSFGVQIARATGCRVIATAGTASKRARAMELGAELAVDHYDGDIVSTVRDATDGRGVDVVLDHVGTPVFAAAMRSLAPEGRFVTCGVTAGPMAELHLGQLFVKGISLMGVGRPDNQRIAATMRELLAMIHQGRVTPVIAATFPLEEIAQAHRLMESSAFFGKIVLVP